MSEKSEPLPDQGPSPIGEISQEPSAFEAFLDANQKKLIIVGIIIILALIAYVVVDGLAQQRVKQDSAAVTKAVIAENPIAELEKLISDKAGTNSAGTALLHKSQLQWRDLQQNEAVASLEKFVSEYPEHPAFASGVMTLASYQKELGNIDKAKELYQQAADANAAVSSLALITLGDIARIEGNEDEAKTYYDRAESEYGELHAGISTLAKNHAKLLGVTAPTMVKPEPPKPPASSPEAASNPVKINPLPTAPDLPKEPTPGAPNTTKPVMPQPIVPTPTPAPTPK